MAVTVVVGPLLGHRVKNELDLWVEGRLNCLFNLLGIVLVFCLIVTCVPLVGTAILAELDNYNVPDVFNSLV